MDVEEEVARWRAATGMYAVSRHVVAHVQRLMRAIGQENYNDEMVKELLILIREFAREKILPQQEGSVKEEFALLVDVCDFIAHPMRFKGVAHNRIVDVLLQQIESFEKGGSLDSNPFDAGAVAWRLLGAAELLLETGEAQVPKIENISNTFVREIAASILCNLQDTRFELSKETRNAADGKKEKIILGTARLSVSTYDGELRLYASVVISKELLATTRFTPKRTSFVLFRTGFKTDTHLPTREIPAYVCAYKHNGKPLHIAVVAPAIGDGSTIVEMSSCYVLPTFADSR